MEKPNRDELVGIIAGAEYAKEIISDGKQTATRQSTNLSNSHLVKEDQDRARDYYEGMKDISQIYADIISTYIGERIKELMKIS